MSSKRRAPLATAADAALQPLVAELGALIRQARQRALRAVDPIQVQTAGSWAGTSSNSSRVARHGRLTASACCPCWPSR